MLRLEDISYLADKLNMFITVDGVKRLVMLGKLESVPVPEEKKKYHVSKYSYGVSKKSFTHFLEAEGFEEKEIIKVFEE